MSISITPQTSLNQISQGQSLVYEAKSSSVLAGDQNFSPSDAITLNNDITAYQKDANASTGGNLMNAIGVLLDQASDKGDQKAWTALTKLVSELDTSQSDAKAFDDQHQAQGSGDSSHPAAPALTDYDPTAAEPLQQGNDGVTKS